MKIKILKKDLAKISKIIFNRRQSVFKEKITINKRREEYEKLTKAFEEKRLIYEILPSGKVGFFFVYEYTIMHEYQEEFFHVSQCYCIDNLKIRRKFYALIKEIARAVKTIRKINRMVIDISVEDHLSKKYFLQTGRLTAVVLVGKTKEGLKSLNKEKINATHVVLKRMSAKDLSALVTLEIASHISDKTSRMREIFIKPEARNMTKKFYRNMVKRRSCIVAKKGQKIVGSICYFMDKKLKKASVAAIFVANSFKGQGISKLLYKKLLEDFDKAGLKYYMGSSTTERVLSQTSKMGRRELCSSIIVKI